MSFLFIRFLAFWGIIVWSQLVCCCSVSDTVGTINSNAPHPVVDNGATIQPQPVAPGSVLRKRFSSLSQNDVLKQPAGNELPLFSPKHAYLFPAKFKERFRASAVGPNYFKTFSFKGVGVSFVKSLVDLRSCGVGLRIPITSHFPVYDSVAHLPRLNGMIGYMYPGFVKVDVSASVPLPVVLYWMLVVLKSKEFADLFQKSVKATDSVKRVGFTTSFKIQNKLVTPSIGPMILMVPSVSLFQTLLPIYLAVPTLTIGILGLFYFWLQLMGFKSKGTPNDPPLPTRPVSYALYYWRLLKAWIATMAASMAINASKSYTRKSSAFGYGMQFNIDSLYPFADTLDSIRSFVAGKPQPVAVDIIPRSRFLS